MTFKHGLLAVAIANISVLALTPAYAADGEADIAELDKVTVTGEKIDRSLKDVSGSVSVMTGDAFDNGENLNIDDVLDEVPNLVISPAGLPSIRGADGRGAASGFWSYVVGARPRVTTFIDGAPESWTGVSFGKAGMWDVNQVEVFRGPQSTTQGRNSIGGAVVINTNDPTVDWEGKVRTGYETEDGKAYVAGVISGPVYDDQLAFRLAGEKMKGDTFTDYRLESGDDYPWDTTEVEFTNVRGKLMWMPKAIPQLTAKLTVSARSDKGPYSALATEPYEDKVYVCDDTDGAGGQDTTARCERKQETTNKTYIGDVRYELSDGLTATVQLTSRQYETDFDGYPATTWTGDTDEDNTSFEARLEYAPANSALSGVLGIYNYKREQDILINYYGSAVGTTAADGDLTTTAVFADAVYAATEDFDVLFGLRVEKEKEDREVVDYGDDMSHDTSKTVVLPKIGFGMDISDATRVGMTARKGYNAGGMSYSYSLGETYEFDSEEVWTLEGTVKNELDRGYLNVSVFYSDYTDYQGYVNWAFVNVESSKIYGAEFEAGYDLTDTITLSGFVGLLQTEITDGGDVDGVDGNDLSFSPDTSAGVTFTQNFGNGLFYGADVKYVGEYYNELTNDKDQLAGDYVLTNVNAGYKTASYTVRVYGNNITDEDYVYSYKDAGVAEVGAPATYGVTFDYNF